MAAHKRWNFLAAVGISALMLAANACSEDTTDNKGNTGGDGDNTGGDGDNTGGDGDGDSTAKPILGDNVAGKGCAAKADCGTDAKANCATTLTGGTLPGLIAGFLPIELDLSMEAPGGYCTASCTKDAQCGEGAVCFGVLPIDLIPTTGECRPTCSNNDDCRDGYECAALDASGLENLDLGGGGGGGLLSGIDIGTFIDGAVPKTCQPKPKTTPIADGIVGTACSSDADCGAGSCLGATAATDTAEAVEGSCTAVCAADSDCGAGGACLGQFYGSRGQCAETCNADSDCKRDGFTCTDLLGTKTCLPPQPTTNNPDAGADDPGTESDAGTDAGV